MGWSNAFLSAAITALAGSALTFFLAGRLLRWSNGTGGNHDDSQFLAFVTIVCFLVSLPVGLIFAKMGSVGFLHATARSVAVVVAVVGALYLLTRGSLDVAPEIDGDTLELHVELRPPQTWQPSNSALAGNNSCSLLSPSGAVRSRPSHGAVNLDLAIQTANRWTIPCQVSLHSSRTPLRLQMQLGHEPIVEFNLPLPAYPTAQHEQWSGWRDTLSGYSYRVKVKRYAIANAERHAEALAATARAHQNFTRLTSSSPLKNWLPFVTGENTSADSTAAKEHLTSHLNEFGELLDDGDLDVVRQALEFLQTRGETPPSLHVAVVAAGRHVLPLLASARLHPDERIENKARNFGTLWQRVAERTGAPMAAEQNKIYQAAAFATSGAVLDLAHEMRPGQN